MPTLRVFSWACLSALILVASSSYARERPNEAAFKNRGPGKDALGNGVVAGRVTTGGVPVRRVEVSIRAGTEVRVTSCTTDTDGRYRFTGVPGGPFTVNAYWLEESGVPGGRSLTRSGQLKKKGKAVVDFDFDEGSSGIEGKVTMAGKPALAGAAMALTLSSGGVESQMLRVAPDGTFCVANLPPSRAQISFTCRSEDGKGKRYKNVICDLPPGKTVKLNVEFQEGVSVSGKLRGIEQGKYYSVCALAGEWKAEDCDRGPDAMFERMARMAGVCLLEAGTETYEVKHLDPGRVTLVVYYAGGNREIRTTKPIALRVLQVGQEPLTNVDFDLPPP